MSVSMSVVAVAVSFQRAHDVCYQRGILVVFWLTRCTI